MALAESTNMSYVLVYRYSCNSGNNNPCIVKQPLAKLKINLPEQMSTDGLIVGNATIKDA